MLISAGRSLEAAVNRSLESAGAEHWNLADAPHGAALKTDPRGYERRVIPFLDRALDVG